MDDGAREILRCSVCEWGQPGEEYQVVLWRDRKSALLFCRDCAADFIDGAAEVWGKSFVREPARRKRRIGSEKRWATEVDDAADR